MNLKGTINSGQIKIRAENGVSIAGKIDSHFLEIFTQNLSTEKESLLNIGQGLFAENSRANLDGTISGQADLIILSKNQLDIGGDISGNEIRIDANLLSLAGSLRSNKLKSTSAIQFMENQEEKYAGITVNAQRFQVLEPGSIDSKSDLHISSNETEIRGSLQAVGQLISSGNKFSLGSQGELISLEDQVLVSGQSLRSLGTIKGQDVSLVAGEKGFVSGILEGKNSVTVDLNDEKLENFAKAKISAGSWVLLKGKFDAKEAYELMAGIDGIQTPNLKIITSEPIVITKNLVNPNGRELLAPYLRLDENVTMNFASFAADLDNGLGMKSGAKIATTRGGVNLTSRGGGLQMNPSASILSAGVVNIQTVGDVLLAGERTEDGDLKYATISGQEIKIDTQGRMISIGSEILSRGQLLIKAKEGLVIVPISWYEQSMQRKKGILVDKYYSVAQEHQKRAKLKGQNIHLESFGDSELTNIDVAGHARKAGVTIEEKAKNYERTLIGKQLNATAQTLVAATKAFVTGFILAIPVIGQTAGMALATAANTALDFTIAEAAGTEFSMEDSLKQNAESVVVAQFSAKIVQPQMKEIFDQSSFLARASSNFASQMSTTLLVSSLHGRSIDINTIGSTLLSSLVNTGIDSSNVDFVKNIKSEYPTFFDGASGGFSNALIQYATTGKVDWESAVLSGIERVLVQKAEQFGKQYADDLYIAAMGSEENALKALLQEKQGLEKSESLSGNGEELLTRLAKEKYVAIVGDKELAIRTLFEECQLNEIPQVNTPDELLDFLIKERIHYNPNFLSEAAAQMDGSTVDAPSYRLLQDENTHLDLDLDSEEAPRVLESKQETGLDQNIEQELQNSSTTLVTSENDSQLDTQPGVINAAFEQDPADGTGVSESEQLDTQKEESSEISSEKRRRTLEGLIPHAVKGSGVAGPPFTTAGFEQESLEISPDHRDELGKTIKETYENPYKLIESIEKIISDHFCFTPETQVSTPLGSKEIGEIEIGDEVVSCDGSYCVTTEVYNVIHHKEKSVITLRTNHGDLKLTPDHPVYSSDDGCFKEAAELEIGEELYSQSGDRVFVEEIIDQGERSEVVDISVKEFPNFYVFPEDSEGRLSDISILVHNCMSTDPKLKEDQDKAAKDAFLRNIKGKANYIARYWDDPKKAIEEDSKTLFETVLTLVQLKVAFKQQMRSDPTVIVKFLGDELINATHEYAAIPLEEKNQKFGELRGDLTADFVVDAITGEIIFLGAKGAKSVAQSSLKKIKLLKDLDRLKIANATRKVGDSFHDPLFQLLENMRQKPLGNVLFPEMTLQAVKNEGRVGRLSTKAKPRVPEPKIASNNPRGHKLETKAQKNGKVSETPQAGQQPERAKGVGDGYSNAGTGLKWNDGKLGKYDKDLRGTGKSFDSALEDAFKQTGYQREQFKVTKQEKDKWGKSAPVEWQGPNGAEVNIDFPHYKVDPHTGAWATGPDAPHIGWQVGKKANKKVGHILIDDVPYNR